MKRGILLDPRCLSKGRVKRQNSSCNPIALYQIRITEYSPSNGVSPYTNHQHVSIDQAESCTLCRVTLAIKPIKFHEGYHNRLYPPLLRVVLTATHWSWVTRLIYPTTTCASATMIFLSRGSAFIDWQRLRYCVEIDEFPVARNRSKPNCTSPYSLPWRSGAQQESFLHSLLAMWYNQCT
jgi:hypothetical protein